MSKAAIPFALATADAVQTVAVRHAHAFLAHSSLMGAYDVRKALEYALSKAGGAE